MTVQRWLPWWTAMLVAATLLSGCFDLDRQAPRIDPDAAVTELGEHDGPLDSVADRAVEASVSDLGCGDGPPCGEQATCREGRCCRASELCDGIDNTCDDQVDEGCCPTGMTWRADLQLCYAGAFAPATWAVAAADCRERGGCIGSPAAVLQACGTWLDGAKQDPWYVCYAPENQYDGDSSSCGGTVQTTACDCTASAQLSHCEQRYICAAGPLLPRRLPCEIDDDCGRSQTCAIDGSCVASGLPFCCDAADCGGESCVRPRATSGRCRLPGGSGGGSSGD